MPDIDIDDGLHSVTVEGTEYRLDLIAISDEINRIIERHQGVKSGYPHLTDFREYMAKGWGMELRPAQAERLWHAVVLEVNRQKKEFVDAVKSLSSTASTPSEEPEEE